MNPISNKTIRTNKTSLTVGIGTITLAIGLVIGVTVAEASGSSGSKSASGASSSTQAQSGSNSQPGSLDQWNPFQQIRNMQARMDRMFNQMNRQFQSEPGFSGFPNNPGYSLSLDVRDMKDHYEVHAYLPDAKASSVHVTLKNDQTLKVEVDSQHTTKSSNGSGNTNSFTNVADWGQYEQTVQLPTPVKAGQMKIKRHGHELIINIPKKS